MNPALLPVVVLLATAAPAPPPADAGLRSYVRARQVLDAGIAAHGGPAALLGVRSVRRQLTGGWTNPFQGPRPSALVGPSLAIPPILFPDELLSFVDYAAGRWYERLEESNYSGDHVTQVDAIDGETGFDALAYFDEKPIYRAFDAAEVRATRSEKLRRYPEGALRMALTRPETLQWVGEDEELRRRQQVISLTDPAGTRVLLSFDAASGLLTKTAWLREHAVAGDTYGENLYLDYRRVGGLMLPFHYVDRVGGLAWQHFTASAIALDVDVPAESFQPPRDVAPAQRDPDERTVEPLGGDAYL
ncbi:MAG TPA: hypothetical protein VGV61_01310, partial [Thermoanaerobaculia bacterium]|nr:hypothetical protein [Thermoanaerobaculia bacterium]